MDDELRRLKKKIEKEYLYHIKYFQDECEKFTKKAKECNSDYYKGQADAYESCAQYLMFVFPDLSTRFHGQSTKTPLRKVSAARNPATRKTTTRKSATHR